MPGKGFVINGLGFRFPFWYCSIFKEILFSGLFPSCPTILTLSFCPLATVGSVSSIGTIPSAWWRPTTLFTLRSRRNAARISNTGNSQSIRDLGSSEKIPNFWHLSLSLNVSLLFKAQFFVIIKAWRCLSHWRRGRDHKDFGRSWYQGSSRGQGSREDNYHAGRSCKHYR